MKHDKRKVINNVNLILDILLIKHIESLLAIVITPLVDNLLLKSLENNKKTN